MPRLLSRHAFLAILCATLGGFHPPSAAADEAGDWRAGFAAVPITPRESMWLSGYGSRNHPSEGRRTELWAKAMVLESPAGVRGAVITLDLVGIDRDTANAIRNGCQESTGIPAANIVLSASHTHTGPVVGNNLTTMYFYGEDEEAKVKRYTAGLIAALPNLCLQATRAVVPARLSWGVGHETFGVNRRNNPEPLVPAHRAAGTLRGPVDPRVPVLRISQTNNVLLGLMFGYACHATVLDDYQWSGDYPGFAQLELERRHPGVRALFVAGCGADVNPLPRRTPELAQAYGVRLADAVDRTLGGVLIPVRPQLDIRATEIQLPFDALPDPAVWKEKAMSTDRYIAAHAREMLRRIARDGRLATEYPYPIRIWTLGSELQWLTLGGEVVVDYSLRFKAARSAAARGESVPGLWVSGYCHDVMAYIPSRRVWEEGGYEGGGSMIYYGLPTRWAGDIESRIHDAATRLLER